MLRGRRKGGLRKPMHKAEGVKEWKHESRHRKKAVLILWLVWRASHARCRNARRNDLTRFGTACLLLRHFNTHRPITPWYTGHQFPDWKFGKVSAIRLSSKTNKMFTHSNDWLVYCDPDSNHQHCILSTWLFSHFTINEPWTGKFPRNESLDKTQSTKSTVKLQADVWAETKQLQALIITIIWVLPDQKSTFLFSLTTTCVCLHTSYEIMGLGGGWGP